MAYEDFLGLKPEETPSLPTRWINIDVSQGQDVEKVQEMVTKAIEKYADEYAASDKAEIDAKRKAKSEGNFYVPAEAKIAFVIRTRG